MESAFTCFRQEQKQIYFVITVQEFPVKENTLQQKCDKMSVFIK